MQIRPAQPVDVPAVLPMVARTCAFHERADPAKYPFRPGVVQGYDGWLRHRAADERSVLLLIENPSPPDPHIGVNLFGPQKGQRPPDCTEMPRT
jgi:hypothetical protein